MRESKIVNPGGVSNVMHHCVGAAILPVNKVRHAVMGYRTPRPFGASEITRAVEYDFSVAEGWLDCLEQYGGGAVDLAGKSVLELGPGADLGTGLILLAMGAEKYAAVDVNDLADGASDEFYDKLLERLADRADVETLRGELASARKNAGDKLQYHCNRDFDLSVLPDNSVDLIVSQAAFEHFDDVKRTVEQMSKLAMPGATLVCEIDLATHTRRIRDRDPLNIYRYTDWFYNLMKFRGSPNRVRPQDYRRILADAGWINIEQYPLAVLDKNYLAQIQPSLAKQFKEDPEMSQLSIAICAQSPRINSKG